MYDNLVFIVLLVYFMHLGSCPLKDKERAWNGRTERLTTSTNGVTFQLCFVLEEPEKKDGSVCENGAA